MNKIKQSGIPDENVFCTSEDLGSKSYSGIFSDPSDYIYNAYKQISEKDANDFRAYRKKWDDSLKFEQVNFPLYILTELTFSCNYRCPQCILGDDEQRIKYSPDPLIMSFDLFKRIIDEGKANGCRSLCLNFINEPLLCKDLIERIEYAKKQGFLDIFMNTNGELLNEKNSERLIKSGLTRLMVSIDAHSEETFKKIRVGGNYEKVKENTIRLMKIREKLGYTLPLIRTSFVLQKDNQHELEEFKKYWMNVVDYVHIQIYAKPYDTAEDFRINNEQELPTETFRCDQPNNRIVIRADGTVNPCCSSYAYELPMGNVMINSVYEIWNSPQFKELRQIHFDGKYQKNEICAKCIKAF